MPQLEIHPTLDEVRALSQRGNLIPIYATVSTDLDTPVSLFMKLSGSEPAFLLESVDGGERVARYSFLGVRLREALVLQNGALRRHTLAAESLEIGEDLIARARQQLNNDTCDVLDALRLEMQRYQFVPLPMEQGQLPRFCGGLVGYTGYDVVRQFERLPNTARDVLGVPDAVYFFVDTIVAFDHVKHRTLIIANAHIRGDADVETAYADAVARIKTIYARFNSPLPSLAPDPSAECTPAQSNKTQPEFEQAVVAAKEFIKSGDTFQIQISRRVKRKTTARPFMIYRSLRRINPSPWMFYFDFGKVLGGAQTPTLRLVGASPEMHARYEDGVATVRPIAGTRRRGYTDAEDRAMANELINDPKERAEHVMLIDLARNDIGRIAKYGTVKVPDLMVIENYSHVMHIVSSVQGEVRDGLDAYDVLRATFPAGTLTGAPKVRTMEIIEQLEGERRGVYGGCIGYFSFNGQMDTCIAIRTIVMQGDTCYVQAAGGVVADSQPALEYKESANKMRAALLAIDDAENQ
jgi:anthranilate synthase component 1